LIIQSAIVNDNNQHFFHCNVHPATQKELAMKRLLVLPLLLIFVLSCPLLSSAAPDRIHPYTQQLTDQWQAGLDKAEAASKPNGDMAVAKKSIESLEEFFKEKKQTLERHPDYKKYLLRQVLLRIKLAKITAISGLAQAEAGLKKGSAEFFTGKGGAYDEMAKADALVEAVASVTGKEQQAYADLLAYVNQVRGKIKEKADQIKVGGVGMVTDPGVKLHPHTKQTFETWLKNMEEDRAVFASNKSLDSKLKELEGGHRWYRSNLQELKKHPNYAKAAERMTELDVNLGELKCQKALDFARTGVKNENPNIFNDSAGTYQVLKEAEKILEDCSKDRGAADKLCSQLATSIADARTGVEKLKIEYKRTAAQKYRLPAEKYSGGDKAKLKKMVLDKWKELHPNDKVLGVRFHMADWQRKKESNFNNGTWYHYDNSVLAVLVVVKTSAELATVYPAYVNKNNQSGAMTIGADTKGGSYVQEDMLLKNVSF